jgi:hypothetical protein
MNLAFWIALTIVTVLSTLCMRASVRLVARGADNGWDNALGYVVATGLVLFFPVRWMLGSHSWALMLLAPVVCWIVQVIALRAIYQLNALHALILGVTHTLIATFVTTSVAIGTGIVLAYILYGQIISDPVRIIKIILRLIGIDLPF